MLRIKQVIAGVIIVSFALLSCDALVSPSDRDDNRLSESDLERFQNSAEILAVEYVLDKHPDQIEIPNKIVDLFYNGLVHVANSSLSEANTVIFEKSINARGKFAKREILVLPDTTNASELLDKWQKKEPLTGNPNVDALMNEYEISIIQFSELKSMPHAMVTMQTEELVNILPIAEKLERVDGITSAGPSGIMGDGSTIHAEIKEDYLRLQFVYGWGDCMAGCINKKYWDFNVYEDGTVEFDGVTE